MEQFCLPAEIVSELDATKADVSSRQTYSAETIKAVTDVARYNGVQSAARQYFSKTSVDIPERTIQKWLKFFKDTGSYVDPKQRGRKRLLTEEEEHSVVDSLGKVRAAPHCRSVAASTASAVARGILSRSRPGLLKKEGGPAVMGREYARVLLKRNNWAKRAKTSDRTVPDTEVVEAAGPFFADVKRFARCVPPCLLINIDEFCLLLDGQSKWTWHPASRPGGIAIRDARLGFTVGVVSNAAGDVLLLQLIFKGSTNTVHAQVPMGGGNRLILQDHQPESHFQNADTFGRFVDWLLGHVSRQLPQHAPGSRCLLLLDDAQQHWDPAVVRKARDAGVDFLKIPKKMTHIYQPADQYIIADLKRKVTVSWQGWVESLFASRDPDSAVAAMCTTSIPVLKRRMYTYLADAVAALGTDPVLSSWKVTGILKYAYGEDPEHMANAEQIADAVGLDIDLPECCEGCNSDMQLHRCDKCADFVCDGCWLDHEAVTCTHL